MDLYRRFVTEVVPDILRGIPVPDSISGIFKLSASDLAKLTIFTSVSSCLVYSVFTTCRHHFSAKSSACCRDPVVNWSVQKDRDKVVDTLDIEDIAGDKASMCRCWRSHKFPYCDGAHNQHNKDAGDNVGPVNVKKVPNADK